MIRDLNCIYVLIKNNEVIIFDTNLRAFVDKLIEIYPDSRNYDFFYRQFKKSSVIEFDEYNIQRVDK